MSTEITINTKEQPVFIKKKHELDELLKELRKNNKEAISFLLDTMKDPEVPIKTRVTAAQSLVDFEIKVTDQVNKDTLHRLIAETRTSGLSKNLVLEDKEGKPQAPKIDFLEINAV